MAFKVIQGHSFWYQSNACMQLPIARSAKCENANGWFSKQAAKSAVIGRPKSTRFADYQTRQRSREHVETAYMHTTERILCLSVGLLFQCLLYFYNGIFVIIWICDVICCLYHVFIVCSNSANWPHAIPNYYRYHQFATPFNNKQQQSRTVARKPCDAAAILFGLKFADNIHYKRKRERTFNSIIEYSIIV